MTAWNVCIVHVLSLIWRQGVPHTRTGSRETSVAETVVCVCMERHLSDADRSCGRPVSAMSWMSEARYFGVCPANDWISLMSSHILPQITPAFAFWIFRHVLGIVEAIVFTFCTFAGHNFIALSRHNKRPPNERGRRHLTHSTARRHGSAEYAVIVCPSVRPSVRHKPALYQNGYADDHANNATR